MSANNIEDMSDWEAMLDQLLSPMVLAMPVLAPFRIKSFIQKLLRFNTSKTEGLCREEFLKQLQNKVNYELSQNLIHVSRVIDGCDFIDIETKAKIKENINKCLK